MEEYGRKLRLIWHFTTDERIFSVDKSRTKSSFNPRNKDAVIETYLSCLEERLLDTEIPSKRYSNLTREELDALYSLKDDSTIILKGCDKGLVVVVWDREDLKEAYEQLEDREVYEEVSNDPNALVGTIIKKFVYAVICRVILSIILLLRIQNLLGFICYPEFISVYTMYLVDQ